MFILGVVWEKFARAKFSPEEISLRRMREVEIFNTIGSVCIYFFDFSNLR